MPTVSSSCVSSLPALPTKGVPVSSSCWPGASPIINSLAEALPSAKTVWVRVQASSQAWQWLTVVANKSNGW